RGDVAPAGGGAAGVADVVRLAPGGRPRPPAGDRRLRRDRDRRAAPGGGDDAARRRRARAAGGAAAGRGVPGMSGANRGAWGVDPPQEARMSEADRGVTERIEEEFRSAGVTGWLHVVDMDSGREGADRADEPVVLAPGVKVPLPAACPRAAPGGGRDPA